MPQFDLEGSRDFRWLLTNGQIALGELKGSIESIKRNVIKPLQDRQIGKPREWKTDKSSWARYTFKTDILWYPVQPVLFTFCDDGLTLIEFSENADPDPGWDYSAAVEQYFRMKTEILKHLDTETSCREADERNMEAVWDFASLSLYLTCDVKSGGCGVGVRALGVKNDGHPER